MNPNKASSPSKHRVTTEFLSTRHALMGFIMVLVRDPDDAEDIFQEVWIALASALERGEEIENPGKWCRGVARNLALKHWRDERRSRVIPNSDWIDRFDLAFSEQEARAEYWSARQEALKRCLESLPECARDLLSLRYERGLSMAALAERLTRSVTAVTKSLSRIRALLGECVERSLKLELEP